MTLLEEKYFFERNIKRHKNTVKIKYSKFCQMGALDDEVIRPLTSEIPIFIGVSVTLTQTRLGSVSSPRD